MEKLFGTDGIRGTANQYPMTADMAVRTGRAIAVFFGARQTAGEFVVGMDTRISGPMLAHALAAGICSMGADTLWAGIVPTPAVALLTKTGRASAGIVISASHNPFQDNGIKIFDPNGFKLAEKTENDIEALILDKENSTRCFNVETPGKVSYLKNSGKQYLDFLKRTVPGGFSLSGMKIVLDCANGATFEVAPMVFKELGAEVETLFVSPDGRNINHDCGSQNTVTLADRVVRTGARLGLAFDGDGDRLIAVDETGRIVTGDQILAVCACHMKVRGTLTGNRVVSTVMSNLGLRCALKSMGIAHAMTGVGDRLVMEEMRASGAVLGGEDSGHLIFLNHHSTGDGILAALKLLEAMKSSSEPLSELSGIMRRFPQKLMNVKVSRKPDLSSVSEVQDAVRKIEQELQGNGRVLVRYSGTQPLCRVMVEAPTDEQTENCCHRIADVVARVLA